MEEEFEDVFPSISNTTVNTTTTNTTSQDVGSLTAVDNGFEDVFPSSGTSAATEAPGATSQVVPDPFSETGDFVSDVINRPSFAAARLSLGIQNRFNEAKANPLGFAASIAQDAIGGAIHGLGGLVALPGEASRGFQPLDEGEVPSFIEFGGNAIEDLGVFIADDVSSPTFGVLNVAGPTPTALGISKAGVIGNSLVRDIPRQFRASGAKIAKQQDAAISQAEFAANSRAARTAQADNIAEEVLTDTERLELGITPKVSIQQATANARAKAKAKIEKTLAPASLKVITEAIGVVSPTTAKAINNIVDKVLQPISGKARAKVYRKAKQDLEDLGYSPGDAEAILTTKKRLDLSGFPKAPSKVIKDKLSRATVGLEVSRELRRQVRNAAPNVATPTNSERLFRVGSDAPFKPSTSAVDLAEEQVINRGNKALNDQTIVDNDRFSVQPFTTAPTRNDRINEVIDIGNDGTKSYQSQVQNFRDVVATHFDGDATAAIAELNKKSNARILFGTKEVTAKDIEKAKTFIKDNDLIDAATPDVDSKAFNLAQRSNSSRLLRPGSAIPKNRPQGFRGGGINTSTSTPVSKYSQTPGVLSKGYKVGTDKVLDVLHKAGTDITQADLAKELGIGVKAIEKRIAKLKASGDLRTYKVGGKTHYVFGKDIDTIDNGFDAKATNDFRLGKTNVDGKTVVPDRVLEFDKPSDLVNQDDLGDAVSNLELLFLKPKKRPKKRGAITGPPSRR